MQGFVKFFDFRRKFGFIEVTGNPDVFFHLSGLARGFTEAVLVPGTPVEFETMPGLKGRKAVNVRPVGEVR